MDSESDKSLLDYFIERTDERLQTMDAKIDQMLAFKWQIIGGSIVVSGVLSIIVSLTVAFIERH